MSKYKTLTVILICIVISLINIWQIVAPSAEQMYIQVGTGKLAEVIKIPRHVMKSKDCEVYRKWAASSSFTYFHQDKCPWRAKPKGETGEFIVNGVQLNIPRDYLVMDKDEPDGEVTSQYIEVAYENEKLRAARKEDDTNENRYKTFIIEIESMKKFCEYRTKSEECNPMQIQYESATHASDNDYTTQCKLCEENSKYGTNIYHWYHKLDSSRKGFIYEYYIIGSPDKPNYWLKCPNVAVNNTNIDQRPIICETFFNYKKDFIIDHKLNKKLLDHQLKIRNEIEKLINSFITGVRYD